MAEADAARDLVHTGRESARLRDDDCQVCSDLQTHLGRRSHLRVGVFPVTPPDSAGFGGVFDSVDSQVHTFDQAQPRTPIVGLAYANLEAGACPHRTYIAEAGALDVAAFKHGRAPQL